MVSTYRVGSDTFTYTYNADGRITHIRQNNVLRGHYGYYADGQLRRENNLDTGKTVIYTYDNGGNLTKKTEYPYTTSGTLGTATSTISYTYDSTWKDKLTSYNGQSISYDAMGNPTSYRGATLTWFGRQLKSYTKGNTSVSYEYDENGLRTQKTVNGVVHDYYYVGDRLVYEKSGDSYELFYCYDADGRLAMVQRVIISSGTTNRFFAITNAQGDVIGLRSTTGAVIARYNYDAFGKLISVTDGNGNALTGNNFATQNGVRYRGYYYDSETGLYYLQSRYYDPETGRFLNADDVNFLGATGTPISYNAFAYCENDPVNYNDKTGTSGNITNVAKKATKYFIKQILLKRLSKIGKYNNLIYKIKTSYSIKINSKKYDKSEIIEYKVTVYSKVSNYYSTDIYELYLGNWNAWDKCVREVESNRLYQIYSSFSGAFVRSAISFIVGLKSVMGGFVLSSFDFLASQKLSRVDKFVAGSRATLNSYFNNNNRNALFEYIQSVETGIIVNNTIGNNQMGSSKEYIDDYINEV